MMQSLAGLPSTNHQLLFLIIVRRCIRIHRAFYRYDYEMAIGMVMASEQGR